MLVKLSYDKKKGWMGLRHIAPPTLQKSIYIGLIPNLVSAQGSDKARNNGHRDCASGVGMCHRAHFNRLFKSLFFGFLHTNDTNGSCAHERTVRSDVTSGLVPVG